MAEKIAFTVEAPSRADLAVRDHSVLSRSAIKRLADGGHILADGEPVRAGEVLKAGASVEVEVPEPMPARARPENIPLSIVYEDDDIAVVDKPQGMTVHAGAGRYEGTLVNALMYHLRSLSGVGGEIRPGIVHRIDKDTSGLLVVAKNDEAHRSLAEQIAKKSAGREYLALLEGVLKEDGGHISTLIGRDPKDRLRMAVLSGHGRTAETDYFAAERFRDYTLARFVLQTGRTHQIRVHARYIGHPVVGDRVYGFKKQRFRLNGQLLHAYRLTLTHPRTGERMEFIAPLPDHFLNVLEILRRERDSHADS